MTEADSPTDLTSRSQRHVVRRTARERLDDRCTDLAAASTYYAVLALFPAAIALTSLLGLLGQGTSAVEAVLDVVDDLGGAAVTGAVAQSIGVAIGLGSTAVLVWSIAKWPVLGAVVVLVVARLHHATPNVRQRGRELQVWMAAEGNLKLPVRDRSGIEKAEEREREDEARGRDIRRHADARDS